MNRQLYILWAGFAALFNNHVQTAPERPLTFRRGSDENTLVLCDYEKPGWAAFKTPDGQTHREMLPDGDLGQLVTNYGRATGVRIELPPLVGYGETEQAASAAGATAGFSRPPAA